MFRRIKCWLRKDNVKLDIRDERKQTTKNFISKLGVTWHDVEDLLFWKDSRISVAVFILFTAFFWKFIAYELQRITLIIILCLLPTTIKQIQDMLFEFLTEQMQAKVEKENRNLGFELEDVCDLIVDCWTQLDEHYKYLMNLKETSSLKFTMLLAGYFSMLIIILTYVLVANSLFTGGTILYFLPVLNYLGLIDKVMEKCERLLRPVIIHWGHNQTKRVRNKLRKPDRLYPAVPSADSDDDEFLPHSNNHNDKMMLSIPHADDSQSSANELIDEFDLRAQFHHQQLDDHSSDFDEDSFTPAAHTMPSLSQFDSLMEPLDDEFHAGLNFKNVTFSSEFSLNYNDHNFDKDSDNTDDDIEEIPVEYVDGTIKSAVLRQSTQRVSSKQDLPGSEQPVDQEYDFLYSAELNNVTNEEINNQTQDQSTATSSIAKGVSNVLGY